MSPETNPKDRLVILRIQVTRNATDRQIRGDIVRIIERFNESYDKRQIIGVTSIPFVG